MSVKGERPSRRKILDREGSHRISRYPFDIGGAYTYATLASGAEGRPLRPVKDAPGSRQDAFPIEGTQPAPGPETA
jgi:hypothetical protein